MKSPTLLLFHVVSSLFVAALSAAAEANVIGPAETQSIPIKGYNDLEFYYKYASSAYAEACNKPNGNILVSAINESSSDTQGFIARDDGRKEIVLSFRGSTSAWDWLTNFQIVETPFKVANISGPAGVMVHTGFLTAWDSISEGAILAVQSQLVGHPKYSVVTTGHSLGGALSTLAGITIKQILPDVKVRMYTYGQPRVGNVGFANWVDTSFGHANLFRSVHTTDTVPHLPPTLFLPNYTHHGIEYWSFKDPSSAANTKKCALTGEDPKCSSGGDKSGVPHPRDLPHLNYFNIPFGTYFCS